MQTYIKLHTVKLCINLSSYSPYESQVLAVGRAVEQVLSASQVAQAAKIIVTKGLMLLAVTTSGKHCSYGLIM